MINIEIILVNDKSNDDSIKIIQNIQKTDRRIKLISNKKSMGILYSRCIGALQAKGKYIFPLDNDDMFFDDDVINIIYKEAFNFNYDIVGFKAIKAYNYKARINEMKDEDFMHSHNLIIYKPELSLFGISKKGKYKKVEVYIWSKCIKNSIYKKAVNSLGRKRYSIFLNWGEDSSMLFILFNVAESFRYIIKYGIFKYYGKNNSSKKMSNTHKFYGKLFLLDIIFDFTKNDFKSKKFAVYKAIEIRNSKFFKFLNKININYLKLILRKLLSCSYINNKDKMILKITLFLINFFYEIFFWKTTSNKFIIILFKNNYINK
jgi:glycosyltransferase involved in cell wall biosynthesis